MTFLLGAGLAAGDVCFGVMVTLVLDATAAAGDTLAAAGTALLMIAGDDLGDGVAACLKMTPLVLLPWFMLLLTRFLTGVTLTGALTIFEAAVGGLVAILAPPEAS